MLGAWEGTERTLTQGPYTFCSPQQVLPTMRTCPLFLAHHTHKCAQEAYSVALSFLWGMRSRPLRDSILASWALVCEPHAGASSIKASPGLRQEPQGPARGRSPRPASQTQGSLGWPPGARRAKAPPLGGGEEGGGVGPAPRGPGGSAHTGGRPLLRRTMSWVLVLLGLLVHCTGEKPRSSRLPAPSHALLCPDAHPPLCPQAAALSLC